MDALAVAPIDSYHVPDYLDEIEKKKITAVCFDNGMVGGELPYIGIDNHKTGYQLAQELAEQLDHKGQVGIVAGDLKQKGHRERVEMCIRDRFRRDRRYNNCRSCSST